MAWDKESRAAFLNEELDKKGIAGWGRASHIKNKVGCSNASAAAWLEGSCRRTLDMAIKFCDVFDIDLYQWVNGESRGLNITESQLTSLLLEVQKKFEDQYGIDSISKQLAALVLMGLQMQTTWILHEQPAQVFQRRRFMNKVRLTDSQFLAVVRASMCNKTKKDGTLELSDDIKQKTKQVWCLKTNLKVENIIY